MKFIHYSNGVELSLTHGLGTELLDESTYRLQKRVKFEFGPPCPDALLLSPPGVNWPVQCPLDEIHPFFKCCGTEFGQWPVQLYSG
jgi:hypothetical protein